MGKIIAIGGGEIGGPRRTSPGIYPVETQVIDQEIIALTGKPNPTLLFFPTASDDSLDYCNLVERYFERLGCGQVNVLRLSDPKLTPSQLEKAIFSTDAIYVGGGNTLRMMSVWRRMGVDKLLHQAWRQGIVLSGLSAGSICWFNNGNSDSRKFTSDNDKLTKVTGLGLIDALHCPHYDTDLARQADLKRMMRTTPGVAIALENGTALEVVDDKYRIITSLPGKQAYKAYWQGGRYFVEAIAITAEFADLKLLTQKTLRPSSLFRPS